MKELSLSILDIAQNSVKAEAGRIDIEIEENVLLKIEVRDNGRGMSSEMAGEVTNPFSTTRATRRVGLGIPLLKMKAEMTGGSFEIKSEENVGTVVTATFQRDNIDCPPLGDLAETIVTLIQGSPQIRFTLKKTMGDRSFFFDSEELREIMGEVPLNEAEVLAWIRAYINENI